MKYEDLLSENFRSFEVDIGNLSSLFKSDYQNVNGIIRFTFIPYAKLYLRTEIIIVNTNYLSFKYYFVEKASIEIAQPHRANYPNRYQFFSVLKNDQELPGLPTNLPSRKAIWPPADNFTFDYIRNNLSIHNDAIVISPSDSLYWDDQKYVNLPFLPYFSNCKVFKH